MQARILATALFAALAMGAMDANAASAARRMSSKPGMPQRSIAARSIARTCAVVYSEASGSRVGIGAF